MSQTQGLIQEPQFLRSQIAAQQSSGRSSSLNNFIEAFFSAFSFLSFSRYIAYSRRYPYAYFRN